MGLADLHMHTIFSYDGTATVPAVLKRAKQIGLDIIAITDHDEIRGALLAEQLAPQVGIQVIPGVEITTAEGDLLALSIRKLVPAGLPLIETILRVGEQGGFCLAPHPLATGLGVTIFPGTTSVDLVDALWAGTTQVQKGPEWSAARVLGQWFAGYLVSVPGHFNPGMDV